MDRLDLTRANAKKESITESFTAWISEHSIYIAIYIFFFLVAIYVPFGGDDWEISNWYHGGVSTFAGMVKAWGYFNGRIVHNWFTAALDYYRWLWNLLIPLIVVFSIHCVVALCEVKENRRMAVLMAFLMLICVSKDIRAETQFHVNASIPYNFFVCGYFFVAYVLAKDLRHELYNPFDSKPLNGLCFFCLSAVQTLWIENFTIGFLGLIAGFLFLNVIKREKISPAMMGCVLGAVFGSAVMFTSVGIGNRIDSSITLTETIRQNLVYVLRNLVIENYRIICLCFLALVIAIWKTRRAKKASKLVLLYCLWLICNVIVISLFIIVELCAKNYIGFYNIYDTYISVSNGAIGVTWSFLVLLTLLLAVIYSQRSILYLFYFSAFLSVAPMLLSPGARNMLLAEYVIIAITISYLSEISFEYNDFHRICWIVIAFILFARMENYAYWLTKAASVENARRQAISDFKMTSMNAKTPDDLVLILPRHDEEAFIGNLNSRYYENSIIVHFDLNPNSIVLFDDDFLINKINITQGDNDNAIKCSIDQILRYENDYLYTFVIADQDGETITFEQGTESTIEFIPQEGHTYQISCDVLNVKTGQTQSIQSEECTVETRRS